MTNMNKFMSDKPKNVPVTFKGHFTRSNFSCLGASSCASCSVIITDLKNRTGLSNSFLMSRFWRQWRPSWNDHPKLGVCKQIILRGFLECSQYVPFDNFKRKHYWTILWTSQYAFIVANGGHIVWPPAAILEISVASQKRRGEFGHLISIQSTVFPSSLSRKCQSSHFLFWRHCTPQVITPIWPP